MASLTTLFSDEDVTFYILKGLRIEYRDIATSIRTHEQSYTFEELHRPLLGHDNYIRHETHNDIQVTTSNFTQHRSKQYGPLPTPSYGHDNSLSQPTKNNASLDHTHFLARLMALTLVATETHHDVNIALY